jgi:hypothetical protein
MTEQPKIAYRGEGQEIQPGCTLQAHYKQVQALCDALGYAAQQMMARHLAAMMESTAALKASANALGMAVEADQPARADWLSTLAKQHVQEIDKNDRKREYWYGVFQGYRGLLRALEGNVGELEESEREMLERIDWTAAVPHFVVPGFEHVKLEDQHLPGEGA